jgi:hypothetical protein
MIPTNERLTIPMEETTYPSMTYKIVIDKNKINGYTDEIDSLIQSIYLILNTERYEHIIYSWDYGIELLDLYGKPMSYVISELERRITEALMQDNRISEVKNFKFEISRKVIHITFDVVSDLGTIQAEKDFNTTIDSGVM